MEYSQEFLDRNLEELKTLQIDEVKLIDGVRLKGELSNNCCQGCIFEDCFCKSISDDCSNKAWDFIIVEVDENGLTLEDLENENELNGYEHIVFEN